MAILTGRGDNTMCYDSFSQAYYCQTGWNSWGRWLSIVAIVVAAVLVFFLFSCLTHRHRHRKGLKPYRGTAWIGKTLFGHSLSTYNAQDQQQQQPQSSSDNQAGSPPSYQQTGGHYGLNPDYIEGQKNRTELQQPPNAYRSGDDGFQPLSGFNPKEDDGIVR